MTLDVKPNLRRLVVPVSTGILPEQLTVLMEANGFSFDSRVCPVKLAQPSSVDYDDLQMEVVFQQWDQPHAG